MSRIKIKNFGPIKEGYLENDGWLDIKKVTVFIGNQGSGKSTVAKVISTLTWLEKSFNRGDFKVDETTPHSFLKHFEFQGIDEYFQPNTEIDFEGLRYRFSFKRKGNKLEIIKLGDNGYQVPKIMYIPAERNFLSSIEDSFKVTGLPDHLFTFAEELRKAQKQLTSGTVDLPIQNYSYEYDDQKETSFIRGKNYRINLMQASSGFQSLVPLFLVTRYLTNLVVSTNISPRESMSVNQSIRMGEEITSITLDDSKANDQKQTEINNIKSRYINKCVLNIIEEPEQNLYPSSQRLILHTLLGYRRRVPKHNILIITTHSPYIINYLTLAVKAYFLYNKLSYIKSDQYGTPKSKLMQIVPYKARVNPSDLAIYELDERTGTIKLLKSFQGLPSDENFLNQSLAEVNEQFDKLLEIEELCQ